MIRDVFVYTEIEDVETFLLGRKIHVSAIVAPARTLIPESDVDIISAGAGLTKQEARFKAQMEFWERYAWLTKYKELVNKEITWIKGSDFDSDLVEYLHLFKNFDENKKYPAIKYYNLFGDERLLPANLVMYTDPWVEPLYLQATNGWAAHTDTFNALYNAAMELVERDALNRWWHLDLDPIGVYQTDSERGKILAVEIPAAVGKVVTTLFLPEDLPGFLLFAGADVRFKNALIKALLESTLHLPGDEVLQLLMKRIDTQEGVVELSDIMAYYAKQPREKYIKKILDYEPKKEITVDFEREPVSTEEKLKVLTKLTKEYDMWFRDMTPRKYEGIKIVAVWIKDLVPFLNPHELIEHPRLKGMKRRDVLPLA